MNDTPCAFAACVMIGLFLFGISCIAEQERQGKRSKLFESVPVSLPVVVDLTGPTISWDGASPARRLGFRSDGVVVWQRIDAEAKP